MTLEEYYKTIDWSVFGKVFQTCTCKCDWEHARWRSHAIIKLVDGKLHRFCQIPCPLCGEYIDNTSGISSDPEEFTT